MWFAFILPNKVTRFLCKLHLCNRYDGGKSIYFNNFLPIMVRCTDPQGMKRPHLSFPMQMKKTWRAYLLHSSSRLPGLGLYLEALGKVYFIVSES